MNKEITQKLAQAVTCLLCAIVVWRFGSNLEGTEFSGGRLTGPLLTLYDVGGLLFILSLPLALFYRRIAAAITILASLLCLPLYLYFATPGLFRLVFGGEYSVPLQTNFVWNRWTIFGILVLAIAAYAGIRSFLVLGEKRSQNSA
jgi:hypothetical protein